MFWIKIIICILIFIAIGIIRSKVDYIDLSRKQIIYIVTFIVAIISLIIIYIPIHFTIFTIPKLILFLSICLFIWWFVDDDFELAFLTGIVSSFIAYAIALGIYFAGLKDCDPDIEVVNIPIIPITTETTDENSSECYILYELSKYKYCYQHEDNGEELSQIPANGTKIYYITDDKESHIEKEIKTNYLCYKGNKKNNNWSNTKEITYKLYIPKNTIKYSYYDKEKDNKD